MQARRLALSLVVFSLWVPPRRVVAQVCDDGSACTVNDMCVANRRCVGSPVSGGPCDDANECLTNRTCENGRCGGTPVENGTSCNRGCGQCMSGVCTRNPAADGMPCEDSLGVCTTGDHCQFGVCFGTFIRCNDEDHNKCTDEVCDPSVGHCITITPAPGRECGGCGTCNPLTGICAPLREGMPCDDQDVCTSNSVCSGGACLLGTPNTPGPPMSTPTPTPQLTPTQSACVGDCDGNDHVTVSDLIRGVNIALTRLPVDDCPSFDVDHSGMVTVGELILGVNSALHDC